VHGVIVLLEDETLRGWWNNPEVMKPSARPSVKSPPDSKIKSGLPGTPEQQRQRLRAAIEKNAETLRRLAQ
jgi:hypothetical protein